MKKAEVKTIADRIVTKAKAVNATVRHGASRKDSKLQHELNGMFAILKVLDVEYEVCWDYTVTYMTGLKIPAYNIGIIF